jgi:hypothetical protein
LEAGGGLSVRLMSSLEVAADAFRSVARLKRGRFPASETLNCSAGFASSTSKNSRATTHHDNTARSGGGAARRIGMFSLAS